MTWHGHIFFKKWRMVSGQSKFYNFIICHSKSVVQNFLDGFDIDKDKLIITGYPRV